MLKSIRGVIAAVFAFAAAAPTIAVMPTAQAALIAQRAMITPAKWTPALGKQAKDSDIPAYYTVKENGLLMEVRAAPRPYAIGQIGSWTRFEIQQGDRNFADIPGHTDCDRDELATRDDMYVAVGQVFTGSFSTTFEAGAKNTASWFLLGQFHQDINTSKLPGSPPIAFELLGEKIAVRIRFGANRNDGQKGNTNVLLWKSPNEVVPGKAVKIDFRGIFDPVAGRLVVTVDGVEVARYVRPLGNNAMVGANFTHGLYRQTAPENFAVQQYVSSLVAGMTL